MLYRLPIKVDLEHQREWQIQAAIHLKWDMETFDDMKSVYPRYWQRMLGKRARRLAYAKKHGACPDGWTPPAPGEVFRPAPVIALALRCKNEDSKSACFAKHLANRKRALAAG